MSRVPVGNPKAMDAKPINSKESDENVNSKVVNDTEDYVMIVCIQYGYRLLRFI
jgi:hypothetical protein